MADDPREAQAQVTDAQRDFEQRALRNVRGLVDRIEAEEIARRHAQKWIVVTLVAVVVALGAALAVIVGRTPGPAAEIVVEPASKAPARQDRLHTQHERGREER